jgi:hypothetical protein
VQQLKKGGPGHARDERQVILTVPASPRLRRGGEDDRRPLTSTQSELLCPDV